MTRKRVVALLVVAAMGALCSPVPLSFAASTRAEYIAQVDPLCRANLGPWTKTYKAEVKTYKDWVRLTKKGTLRAWVNQTHKHARAVKGHVRVHATLTDQVSAVPAPAEEAELVADWLGYRNEWERLAQSGANAFDAFKFKRWNKLMGRANKVGVREWDVARSLGLLEHCK